MVAIVGSYCVDIYEAARPDATAVSAGSDASLAVSRAGVLPWQVADNSTAAAACAAAGKRLCTADEWETACRGPLRTVYGYGDTYDPTACNGIDTFGHSGFHLLPTGALAGCTNGMEVLTPPVGRKVAESIRQLQAFQHVRETKGDEVCPAGWEPGKPTLKVGPRLVGRVWEVWKPNE
jgi:hypothetical protein